MLVRNLQHVQSIQVHLFDSYFLCRLQMTSWWPRLNVLAMMRTSIPVSRAQVGQVSQLFLLLSFLSYLHAPVPQSPSQQDSPFQKSTCKKGPIQPLLVMFFCALQGEVELGPFYTCSREGQLQDIRWEHMSRSEQSYGLAEDLRMDQKGHSRASETGQ